MTHPNSLKTHCPKGHPYDETNTIVYTRKSTGKPVRKCAACMREDQAAKRAFYHRKLQTDPEALRRKIEQDRIWKQRHPRKAEAWKVMKAAVRRGELVRPDACERCGTSGGRIEASHDDYDKPLEVEWLCPRCHGAKDRKYGAVR